MRSTKILNALYAAVYSISLLLADDDAEGRDGSMRASVLTACGAWGPTLFHQAHSCPQAGATTCSWQMLMHGEVGQRSCTANADQ